jgi:hypothetical protein
VGVVGVGVEEVRERKARRMTTGHGRVRLHLGVAGMVDGARSYHGLSGRAGALGSREAPSLWFP